MTRSVSPQRFVVAWTLSRYTEQAAKLLRIPARIASSRASYYRKRGVKLKRMPRGRRAG